MWHAIMDSHNRRLLCHVRHLRAGFTLIELLITLAIAGVALQMGLAKFVDFNRSQSIRSIGQTLKNNFRNVQSQALSGVKPATVTCGASFPLDGYQIQFAATSYTAVAVCNNSTAGNPVTTYTLPASFQFRSPLPGTTRFLVLGKGTTVTQVVTGQAYNSPTYYYRLYLSTGGDITDCGYRRGALPSPCP